MCNLQFMYSAYELACKCEDSLYSFKVGCVLVRDQDNKIISTGYSIPSKNPIKKSSKNLHAEQICISNAKMNNKFTYTLYTTMEPCGNRLSSNKTCVDYIINSPIKTVVIGMKEPNTFINKPCGMEKLKLHNINVIMMDVNNKDLDIKYTTLYNDIINLNIISHNKITNVKNKINSAINDFKEGKFVIIADDDDRENEADLVIAAEYIDKHKVEFMRANTSGIICATMDEKRTRELDLHQMVSINKDKHKTAFTITVDHVNTTTGASVADRALTIKALSDPLLCKHDLQKPGHIFPLRAVKGGVLKRRGHTEASVELSKLAGCSGVAAICELIISGNDPRMMTSKESIKFAKNHNISHITVEELVIYVKLKNKEKIRSKL